MQTTHTVSSAPSCWDDVEACWRSLAWRTSPGLHRKLLLVTPALTADLVPNLWTEKHSWNWRQTRVQTLQSEVYSKPVAVASATLLLNRRRPGENLSEPLAWCMEVWRRSRLFAVTCSSTCFTQTWPTGVCSFVFIHLLLVRVIYCFFLYFPHYKS